MHSNYFKIAAISKSYTYCKNYFLVLLRFLRETEQKILMCLLFSRRFESLFLRKGFLFQAND